jgi:hypothetical protein
MWPSGCIDAQTSTFQRIAQPGMVWAQKIPSQSFAAQIAANLGTRSAEGVLTGQAVHVRRPHTTGRHTHRDRTLQVDLGELCIGEIGAGQIGAAQIN